MSPTAPIQDPAQSKAQAPSHPLRNAYEYLRDESDVQVPDTYEEFQAKMLEKPERLRALHDVLDEQDIYTGESYEDFQAKMTAGLDAPALASSAAAPAPAQPRDVLTPTLAPGDEPFVTPEAGQSTALPPELSQAVAQLPAAPQLDAIISGDGRVLDVRRKADDGFQPVDVTDMADRLPPTTPVYRVMNGDQQRVYYDRPLSKVAAGEDHEQTDSEVMMRSMYHQLVSAAHGGAAFGRGLWDELAGGELAQQRAEQGGDWRANTPEEQAALDQGSPLAGVASTVENWQKKLPLSDYHASQQFSVYNPATYPKAIGEGAGMALPLVLSALVPESKLAGVAQKVLGASFDLQMFDGSAQRAAAAGLEPGTEAYNKFVVGDGVATLLTFKLGAAGLSKAGQKLVQTELGQRIVAKLGEGSELGVAAKAAAGELVPVLKQAAKEGVKMGALGAALAAKDEATGRVANQLLGAQKFAEHTPGQLAEDMTSRAVELGTVGALTGAAGAIGQARARRNAEPAAAPGVEPSAPAPAPAPAAPMPAAEPATPRPLEKGEVLAFRGKQGKVRRVDRNAAGEITRIALGNGRSVTAQSAEGKVLIQALREREAGTVVPVVEPAAAGATALESAPVADAALPAAGEAPAPAPVPGQSADEAAPEQAPAAVPTADASGRVVAAPIAGEAPKKRQDILLDLRKLPGVNLRFGKAAPARNVGLFGSYDPATGSMRVSAAGNLDTTARAIGHALNGRYGLTELPASPRAVAERADLMRHGSRPPKGHADPEAFQSGEAWAEYVRARILNPEAARRQYPEFTAHYDRQVPPKVQAQLDAFGRDVRVLEGATAHEAIMSSVRMKPAAKGSIMDVLKPQADGPGFQLTFGDRIKATLLNSFHPFEKAMRYAREVGGGDPASLKPEENPGLLARLYLGIHDKMDNIVERGLVDAKNNRRLDDGPDGTREPMTLKWLYGALDTSTEGTIAHEQEQVISSMIARRTLEMVNKRVAEDIKTALDAGGTVGPAVLASTPSFGRFAAKNAANEAAGGRRVKIDVHQKDVVTGIGAGLVSDVALARQRLTDHDALATSNPAKHARIEEAARRYQAYADANLQYLVEKGRLSKAQYEAIKATNSQYVALQRVMEAEPGAEIQVFTGQSLRQFTRAAAPVKVLQGSGRIIKDPYAALLEATYRTVKEADRNTILLAMRALLDGGKASASGASLSDIGARALAGDPHTVSVFVDGQREAWQLAPELFAAINELGNTPLDGPLAKLLQSPAKLLRWSVTHSPVFAARNLIRDQRSRAVVSTNGLRAGLGAGVRLLTDRAAYRTATDGMELSGGGQAGHYLASEQNYYDTMQRTVAELAQNKRFILADPAKLAKGVWRRYTTLLGGSETLTRKQEYRAAYEKAKGQGMDDYNASLYAAHEARDLMDFAVAGTAMRELNKYVPFTNAAVQGLRKAANSAQSDPGGFALRWAVTSLAPALALRALIHRMGRDDDYAQLPAYQRDGFDNIPLPNGQWLVIPRPFELGTMAASADRYLSKHVYDDPHAWEGYGGSLVKSFVPVDDAAVAGPLKPLLEVMTNHDLYRDKPIVPQYEERLGLALRHTERGSQLGQWVGNAVGLDSRKVDHLVKGMGSYYGDWLLKASNLGRADGMGQSFGVPDSGFIRGSAGPHARDVDYLQKRLVQAGMGQSSLAKEIKEAAEAYYDAPNPDEREQAAEALRELAVRLRAELDDQFFQDQVQQKKEKVNAAN